MAYKQFSGLDPLKLDPQSVLKEVLALVTTKELSEILGKPIEIGQEQNIIPKSEEQKEETPVADLAFRFLLLADTHNDNVNLAKAIEQAKANYSDLEFIIGLGDYTEVGTTDELKNAKKELDNSGLRYFLIPGDHDLWDCRNRNEPAINCFREVFGPTYQAFIFENFKFILLNNSDNYIGFDSDQEKWIAEQLEKKEEVKGVMVFLHEPLFHPSSTHTMGWVEKSLKTQAGGLIFQLKEAEVKKVFAGDIHYFSEYDEPKTDLPMFTIGAVTRERNPQAPRFGVVSVFEDGSSQVEDVEIK
ncbi:MAG: metallophosphoesterase [Candidatus Daviesbacteria bacterium]|nr:metallophosphoesterase [Candidatus Daviesbacteria bacterium]